jgi:Acyltransferase
MSSHERGNVIARSRVIGDAPGRPLLPDASGPSGIPDANLRHMTDALAGPSPSPSPAPTPASAHDAPRRNSALLRAVGRLALRAFGWRLSGDAPHEPKFVAIVAPHTSNWDFVVCIAAMFALDLKIRWLGKDQLFRWPLGVLLHRLGGWPVRRNTPEGLVEQAVAIIEAHDQFVLALAPEGTRSRVPRWRTGFYRIAEAARIPIVPVVLDWGRKEIIIRDPVNPTGDMPRDIAALMTGYHARMARYPASYWEPAA